MSTTDLQKEISLVKQSYEDNKSTLGYNELFIKYLGKKGQVNKLFNKISLLGKDEKLSPLKSVNEIKDFIETDIKSIKTSSIDESKDDQNMYLPVKASETGNLHPITAVTRNLNQFFHYYGFSVYDGPEIETDYYNFEMMGVPADHPARELQDTFYLREPDILLRTQASSIEARELEKQNPPIRFVSAGKVFRNETTNKSNASIFHHYQGVCVDKDITMANLKWIFDKSLKYILGPDTVIRFRAKYYPEVEPGMSPDIKCTFCNGKGCEICKFRGWIEIAGGGMIHPN